MCKYWNTDRFVWQQSNVSDRHPARSTGTKVRKRVEGSIVGPVPHGPLTFHVLSLEEISPIDDLTSETVWESPEPVPDIFGYRRSLPSKLKQTPH